MERRKGDLGAVYANCDLIYKDLGWKAEKDLGAMCEDMWRWLKTKYKADTPEQAHRVESKESELHRIDSGVVVD